MTKTNCRYCPFYCPARTSHIEGACAGIVPTLKVNLLLPVPCPFDFDKSAISDQAWSRGFGGRLLRFIRYKGCSATGFNSH